MKTEGTNTEAAEALDGRATEAQRFDKTGLRWLICYDCPPGSSEPRKAVAAFASREDLFRAYESISGWYGVHLDVIDATTGKSEWKEAA